MNCKKTDKKNKRSEHNRTNIPNKYSVKVLFITHVLCYNSIIKGIQEGLQVIPDLTKNDRFLQPTAERGYLL